jgi:hypothetical protein
VLATRRAFLQQLTCPVQVRAAARGGTRQLQWIRETPPSDAVEENAPANSSRQAARPWVRAPTSARSPGDTCAAGGTTVRFTSAAAFGTPAIKAIAMLADTTRTATRRTEMEGEALDK